MLTLYQHIEETNWGFVGVSGLCTLLTGMACMWGLTRLRKVQRVRISYDRANQRDMRLKKARQVRRDAWKQLSGDATLERGLGETVAGIRSREAISNWKKDKNDYLRARAQASKQASKDAVAQSRKQPDSAAGEGPPVAAGA